MASLTLQHPASGVPAFLVHHRAPVCHCRDGLDRVQQHQDVQGQVVANQVADHQFHRDGGDDDHPDGEARGQHEAEHHGADVAERVQHAVAVVIEGDGGLAIAVDHHVGVLEDFPAAFEQHGEREAHADRQAPRHQPQQAVEREPVDHVGERVPVGEVLRVARTVHLPVPQRHVAAAADRHAAHEQQHQAGGRHQGARRPPPCAELVRRRRRRANRERRCHGITMHREIGSRESGVRSQVGPGVGPGFGSPGVGSGRSWESGVGVGSGLGTRDWARHPAPGTRYPVPGSRSRFPVDCACLSHTSGCIPASRAPSRTSGSRVRPPSSPMPSARPSPDETCLPAPPPAAARPRPSCCRSSTSCSTSRGERRGHSS